MKRPILLACVVALAACAFSAPAAQAQGSRADLLRQATTAYDDFDIPLAVRLARSALNPALGVRDTTWGRGVHLMTQLLIEDQQPAAAQLWARWAMRLEPTLSIDSVRFLGGVVTALSEARAAATRSAADDATQETFVWPSVTSTATQSRIRLAPAAVAVNVLVTGVGLLTAGPGLSLAAGTYDLEVNASGYLPLRITREVLPGVTTELAFTLTSSAAAADVLAADVRARVSRSIVPLTITRFGMAPGCAVGVTAGDGRLVLTSYHAVRGADLVASGSDNGAGVRVAAWDVGANLAVLVVPNAPAEALPLAGALADEQALFGVGLEECRTPTESRVLLNAWDGRPEGSLTLSAALANGIAGSPFVDFEGNIAGVWDEGSSAVPFAVVAPLLATARANVAAGRLLTPQAMALLEQHRYGTVVVTVDVSTASVRVTPLEAWQWEGLAASGAGPLTFSGPAGRYRIEVVAPDVTAQTREFTMLAGERSRFAVTLRPVVRADDVVGRPRRSFPKWAWIAVIGGGAAAAVALGGGGGGGVSGGSIDISVPNP